MAKKKITINKLHLENYSWLIGGLIFGALAFVAVRNLRSLRAKSTGNGMDRDFSETHNTEENKPYPVEATSKHHSRRRVQMRDTAKLSH